MQEEKGIEQEPGQGQDSSRAASAYSQVLKYTGLLGGVQVFYVLMSIIRNKFTALFIGPWGMGMALVYSKAAEFLCSMTNFGLGISAVRRLAELHERGERRAVEQYVKLIRSWTLITALLGFVACIALAPVLSRRMLGDYHSTKGFLLLSPTVFMLTMLGGELAILKGLHELRRMAAVSAVGALLTMLLTVGIYALMGLHGVLPVLLVTSAVTLLLNLHATTRVYPYRLGLRSTQLLRRGGHLIRLGIAFTLAGLIGAGADLVVTSFISRSASPHAVGLYGAGFTLIVSYARIVFVAMDADYYPRLSAAGEDVARRNVIINRQTDTLVMLMAPFLILFSLFLPLVIRIILTEEYLMIVPMAVYGMSYMFFKAVYSPVSYLALARGDSVMYLVMETAYDVAFVVAVTAGYATHGLSGAGLGLSLANLFDLVAITTVYRFRYGFRFDAPVLRRCLYHYLFLLAGLACALIPQLWLKLALGLPVAFASMGLSWRLLSRETDLVERLRARLARTSK
ncbi:MAG: oligosaccharide flippase family protein [Alloprevotella sp.]|nr:oligosaccharide flippase family protein [Alloprevotella sp.]